MADWLNERTYIAHSPVLSGWEELEGNKEYSYGTRPWGSAETRKRWVLCVQQVLGAEAWVPIPEVYCG